MARTRALPFLQLVALVLVVSRLALAILAPLALGTATAAAVVCLPFHLLHEAGIGVDEVSNCLGQGQVGGREALPLVFAGDCRRGKAVEVSLKVVHRDRGGTTYASH